MDNKDLSRFNIQNSTFDILLLFSCPHLPLSSSPSHLKKALDADGNAILGADLDYTEFSSNRVGVIASGTLVEIVKMD
jgi:hypothetical protein